LGRGALVPVANFVNAGYWFSLLSALLSAFFNLAAGRFLRLFFDCLSLSDKVGRIEEAEKRILLSYFDEAIALHRAAKHACLYRK
jgi:hypothetical protein